MNQKKLSVIIPVYLAEKFILKCLRSIDDWIDTEKVEVICVDDGSPDTSGIICDQFSAEYPYVRVIHQKNKGVAGARNTGLQYAEGEYIAWIDPDDYFENDWCRTILEYLGEGVDCILFDYRRFIEVNNQFIECKLGLPRHVSNQKLIYELSCDYKILSFLQNKVIKRSFFEKNKFDEEDRVLEDYHILTLIAPSLKNIRYISKSIFVYVQREHSLTYSMDLDKMNKAVEIAKNRYLHFKKMNYDVSLTGYANMCISFCYLPNANNINYGKAYSHCYNFLFNHFKELMSNNQFKTKFKIALILLKFLPQTFCVRIWVKTKQIRNSLINLKG